MTRDNLEEADLFAARADVVAGRLDQDLEDRLWDLVHSDRPAIREAAIRLAHQAQEKHQAAMGNENDYRSVQEVQPAVRQFACDLAAAMVNEWKPPILLPEGVYTDGVM